MNIRSPKVRVRAPGKINLTLAVGPRDDSGYHELRTIFQAVSVFEDITARPDSLFSLTAEGRDLESIPMDDSNLAMKAAKLLASRAGVIEGVRLHIEKSVPIAGGMAGGSADAAAALVACDHLWESGLTRETMDQLARELGADVPFALMGHTAIGTGRGDILTPALVRGKYHWVLACLNMASSTAEVFADFDETGQAMDEASALERSEAVMQALRTANTVELGRSLFNDLQDVVCRRIPRVRKILDFAHDQGALGAVLSGSGPTVAILADSTEQAIDMSVSLTATGIADDVLRVEGPVPGARIIESSLQEV